MTEYYFHVCPLTHGLSSPQYMELYAPLVNEQNRAADLVNIIGKLFLTQKMQMQWLTFAQTLRDERTLLCASAETQGAQ